MSEGDSERKEAGISQKHSRFWKKKAKKLNHDSQGSQYFREGKDFAAPTTSPYPPLSTLKAGPFAFTRTLREIDPC